MLGTDVCIPGMQEVQVLDAMDCHVQLKVLRFAQRAAIEGLVMRHPKEGATLELLEVDDVVVYALSENERRERVFMGGKSLPRWSEPSCAIKVLIKGEHSPAILVSLWTGKQRQRARRDIRKIAPLWNRDSQELANSVLLYEHPPAKLSGHKWSELVLWEW
eukprot:GHVN01033275.1.p1 GENE.GHVN01033275.1~~GHVN01033275.1.p1  ORF type:complete len:161 (+),score=11.45 GHVN01033275.1:168-650(+)